MNKRYELTDEQWHVVEPILPKRTAKTGRKPKDPRQMLGGIVWILRSGAHWLDMPERYGRWKTVYGHYWRWRDNGTFDPILSALQIRLDRQGHIDWDLWCIDGSSVRAARAAAGANGIRRIDCFCYLPAIENITLRKIAGPHLEPTAFALDRQIASEHTPAPQNRHAPFTHPAASNHRGYHCRADAS